MQAPSIPCPRAERLPETLAEASRDFATTPLTPFNQPWVDCPETRFRPGGVALARDGTHLGIWADLEDDEVFNDGVSSQQPLWALGDVFEIFLRPLPEERYWELHVTPDNLQLRLSFPSELFFWREAVFFKDQPWVWTYALPEGAFVSEAARRPGGWQVWARIPWTTFNRGSAPDDGIEWIGCFCRYDASRQTTAPVLSTTGSHARMQFHDQRGWNPIRF
ncbi:MAG: hypothetical protein OHK005_03650 [Candidatus Methylacidiphilales bacterium]